MVRNVISRWPRGLSHEEAADYAGIGKTKFDEEVSAGRMPKPSWEYGTRKVWDLWDLDRALDAAKQGRDRDELARSREELARRLAEED